MIPNTMFSTDYLLITYVNYCCLAEGNHVPHTMDLGEAHDILKNAAELTAQAAIEIIEHEDDVE